MAAASIKLEDVDGQVRAGVIFEGGYNAQSPAHHAARAMLDHMDSIAQKVEEPKITALDKLKATAAESNNELAERLLIVKG